MPLPKRVLSDHELNNLTAQGFKPRGSGFAGPDGRFVSDDTVMSAAKKEVGMAALSSFGINYRNTDKNVETRPTPVNNNDNNPSNSILNSIAKILSSIDSRLKSQTALQKMLAENEVRASRENKIESQQENVTAQVVPVAEAEPKKAKDAGPGIASSILAALGLGKIGGTAASVAGGVAAGSLVSTILKAVLLPATIALIAGTVVRELIGGEKFDSTINQIVKDPWVEVKKNPEPKEKQKSWVDGMKDAWNQPWFEWKTKDQQEKDLAAKAKAEQAANKYKSYDQLAKDMASPTPDGRDVTIEQYRKMQKNTAVTASQNGGALLNLISSAEGTNRPDGYDTTLGYGKFTGGPVNLTNMTLREVKELQGKMLAHPDNHYNSSAVGKYQIVRKTLKGLQKDLRISDDAKFTPEIQDRMALRLAQGRGNDPKGLRNEWEGLRRVSSEDIKAAYNGQPMPDKGHVGSAIGTQLEDLKDGISSSLADFAKGKSFKYNPKDHFNQGSKPLERSSRILKEDPVVSKGNTVVVAQAPTDSRSRSEPVISQSNVPNPTADVGLDYFFYFTGGKN